MITEKYLKENPNHIFVFGDNLIRKGYGGAAKLRNQPNTYGFITKKYPSNNDDSFYRLDEYKDIFKIEYEKLVAEIISNPDKLYLISQIGNGLANKYKIFENIILPKIVELKVFKNVRFLFDSVN